MEKIKFHSKYTLRGKRSLEENKNENSFMELMTIKRKKRETIIFEMLINEALIKPVEHFQLPSFLLSDNSNGKMDNNHYRLFGKSWEDEDEDVNVKENWEIDQSVEQLNQLGSNMNHFKQVREEVNEDQAFEKIDDTDSQCNGSKLVQSLLASHKEESELDDNSFEYLTNFAESKSDLDDPNDFENESFNSALHSETHGSDILSQPLFHSKSFTQLSSIDKSPVRHIYTYPDSYEADTDTIVLIQDGCISIWLKDLDSGQWNYKYNYLKENALLIASDACEDEDGIWFAFLFDSKHELIFKIIRFTKFEKRFHQTYLDKFIHEFHSLSKTINLCCLNAARAVLSIPTSFNSIDIFIYDLKLSSKNHLTTLRAKDVSVCSILPIIDSHDLLFGHFNNRIYIW
jgi:hypothetical protein